MIRMARELPDVCPSTFKPRLAFFLFDHDEISEGASKVLASGSDSTAHLRLRTYTPLLDLPGYLHDVLGA